MDPVRFLVVPLVVLTPKLSGSFSSRRRSPPPATSNVIIIAAMGSVCRPSSSTKQFHQYVYFMIHSVDLWFVSKYQLLRWSTNDLTPTTLITNPTISKKISSISFWHFTLCLSHGRQKALPLHRHPSLFKRGNLLFLERTDLNLASDINRPFEALIYNVADQRMILNSLRAFPDCRGRYVQKSGVLR